MDWIPDQGETAIKDSTETTGDTGIWIVYWINVFYQY